MAERLDPHEICPVQRDLAGVFLDYCARRLDPGQRELLERHMQVCPSCRELRDQQMAVWAALDDWDLEPALPGFRRRLEERLENARDPLWERALGHLVTVSWRPLIPAAALIAVAFIGLTLHEPSRAVEARQLQSPPQVAVEQAEQALADMEMLSELPL
jgi:hypothetical protein